MISENIFFEELIKDVEAHDAEMSAAAAGPDQETAGDKDTYTRAEVDALIAEKVKEIMEGEKNNDNEEESGAAAGAAGTRDEAGKERGKENE